MAIAYGGLGATLIWKATLAAGATTRTLTVGRQNSAGTLTALGSPINITAGSLLIVRVSLKIAASGNTITVASTEGGVSVPSSSWSSAGNSGTTGTTQYEQVFYRVVGANMIVGSDTISITITAASSTSVTGQVASADFWTGSWSQATALDAAGTAAQGTASPETCTVTPATTTTQLLLGHFAIQTAAGLTYTPGGSTTSGLTEVGTTGGASGTNTITYGTYGTPSVTSGTAVTAQVTASNTSTTHVQQAFLFKEIAPAVATLTDNFTTQDNTKWAGWSANVSIVSGQLQVACTAAYPTLTSAVVYDLLPGSSLIAEIVQTAGVGTTTDTALYLDANATGTTSGRALTMNVENTTLTLRYNTGAGNNDTTVAYNATSMRWWRISESGGTITWATSPDGQTWTTQRTAAPVMSFTGLFVHLQSGFWGTETSPRPAIFDNVNLPPTGTAWTITINDSAGLTDAQALDVGRGLTDTTGIVDSTVLTGQWARTIDDPAGLADNTALDVGRAVTDSAGSTDTLTAGLVFSRTVDDPAGFTDTSTLAVGRGITDSAGLVDSQSLDIGRGLTDPAGLVDATGVSADWRRTVDDPAGLVDSAALGVGRQVDDPAGLVDSQALAVGRQADDNAGLTDTVQPVKSGSTAYTIDDPTGLTDGTALAVSRQLDDPAGLVDSNIAGLVYARQVDDSAGMIDSQALGVGRGVDDPAGLVDSQALAVGRALTDPGGLADATALDVGRSMTDTAGLADTVAALRFALVTVDDSAGLADSQALGVGRGLTDDAGLGDTSQLTATWARSITDNAGITDIATPALSGTAWTVTVTDTAGLADSVSTAAAYGRTLDDPAGFVDTVLFSAVVVRVVDDLAGFSDSAAAAHALTITDLLGLTDALDIVVFTGRQVTYRTASGRTLQTAGTTPRTVGSRTVRSLGSVTTRTAAGTTLRSP